MRKVIVAMLLLAQGPVLAQDRADSNAWTISGYLEAYYCYDLGEPSNHERPDFFYSHDRHNEVTLNIGFIKGSYSNAGMRANLALMAGTYAQSNLASEPELLRHVFEANAGVKISGRHDLWLDVGIMPSHIGFESAIGRDCWTLTRSILADNSPYYEAGLKLGFTSANSKWYAAALYLNGWQRIRRIPGNNTPAFGTQLSYNPTKSTTINWSTYVGNEYPDSARKWRHFHNFFGRLQINPRLGLIAGFDIGMEQERVGSTRLHTWYAPVVVARYAVTKSLDLGLRAEYYRDKHGVVIRTDSLKDFGVAGYSLNLDYSPGKKLKFRIEGRRLDSRHASFWFRNQPVSWNYFFTGSWSVQF